MSSLKHLIEDFVNNEYSDLPESEKSLLKSLSLKKIFSLPYYKDTYHATSVCILDDNDAYFATNKYNLDNGDYMPLLHSAGDKYPDFSLDFDDVKKCLLDTDIISRFEKFFYIAEHHSNTIQEYTDKIIEAQKGDSDFLTTINSFNYIIPDYDFLFFNDYTNKIFSYKDVDIIHSSLFKNETNVTYSNLNGFDPVIADNKWDSSRDDRIKSIMQAQASIENINNYYEQYNHKIQLIESAIKEQKPYLFETTREQEIEFSYHEIKGIVNDRGVSSFTLEYDTCFDKAILNRHGIVISDVYNLIPDEDKYETMQEVVLKHLFKKDDDISHILPSRFYGLDFVNDNALHPSSNGKSYIIAKANDDVVGMIALNSTDPEGKSVIKNMGYVCVKDNFRGTGLVEKMYDKLASICVENHNIIVNSNYTEQGRSKLPRMKQRIREKHTDFLLLDTDMGDLSVSDNEKLITSSKEVFNELFFFELNDLNKSSPETLKKNTKHINKIHRESMSYIDNHKRAFSHNDNRVASLARKKLVNRQILKVKDLLNTSNIKSKIKI